MGVIKRSYGEGGLGLFEFSEFVTSLKLTLIKKILNPHFTHNWKKLCTNQLKFRDNIEISIENCLVLEKVGIVKDILSSYKDWRDAMSAARGRCLNLVVLSTEKC